MANTAMTHEDDGAEALDPRRPAEQHPPDHDRQHTDDPRDQSVKERFGCEERDDKPEQHHDGRDDDAGPQPERLASNQVVCVRHGTFYSERSACTTSTRDARAAGISDATTAAPMSTAAAPSTGSTPGNSTWSKKRAATRARA